MKNIFLFLVGFFLSFLVFSQDSEVEKIEGHVYDQQTGESIPLVNVIIEDKDRGTFTNILGEFELRVDSLPVSLIFSHVGYKRLVKEIRLEAKDLEIPLQIAVLDTLRVSARNDSKLYKLLKKALLRTQQNQNEDHFGRAFYRQLSKNDTTYTELYEIFYDTKFNVNGIEDWALQEGRYALVDKAIAGNFVFNKNFTLINRIFPIIQPEIDLFITPIQPNTINFFDIRTEKIIRADDREVGVFSFKPIQEAVGSTPATWHI